MNLTLLNKTKSKPPISSLLFKKIKNEILGEKYNLSIVLVGNFLSQKINLQYRGKKRPTNILGFPLSKSEGEIFLNLPLIQKEAKEKWRTSYKNFFIYLFIHGLLHLQGLDHGSQMTEKEKNFLKKFNIDLKISF